MNLKSTILILGAGASKPYGYPTAGELRNDIIKEYPGVIRETSNLLGHSWDKTEESIRNIKPIIEKFDLSHTNSIDLFLSRNGDQINITLGIQLIWMFIMWYERRSKMSSQISQSEEDWYYEFFNEFTGDVTTKQDLVNLPKEKIYFITFNYDRSVENYLFLSFKNSFSLTDKETKELINKHFTFYHVYGKVLNLDWESEELAAPYKNRAALSFLDRANKQINLIYNERRIEDHIQDMIKNNNTLIFLGFGFAKANLDFLNLRELLSSTHKIHASGFGLHDSRIINIKSFLQRGIVGIKDHNIQIEPKFNSLQLLRRYIF